MPKTDGYRTWASLLRGIMLTVTTQAGGRNVPWNQYTIGTNTKYDSWLGKGMCQGLAVKFLELERDGRSFVDEVNGASLEVLDKRYVSDLNTEIFEAAKPGNIGDGTKAIGAVDPLVVGRPSLVPSRGDDLLAPASHD